MAVTAKNRRRTQAERREETRRQVLDSACRLFGEKGYTNTSLDDVARDCGLTTRPVYHYFGNKKALFIAVNNVMEERIVASMSPGVADGGIVASWHAFLELCDDPGFRQVVLVDGPNVMGRERWGDSVVASEAVERIAGRRDSERGEHYRHQLLAKMLMGAFTEAALMVAGAEDVELARREAGKLVEEMFGGLEMPDN